MPVLDLIAWSLLIVWAALLAGGFLFRRAPTPERLVPVWVQAASSVILLLLAWYGYLLTRAGADSAGYALGIAAGLTFGLPGGLLMAGAVAPTRRLVGLSAFALGHLLYVSAMAQYGGAFDGVRWFVLGLWLSAGALAGRAVLMRARGPARLRASAAVACTLLLSATAGFATGLALTAPLFGVLAAGALLLIFSELPLAAELSVGWRPPWIAGAARLLRAPGQALIVLSIWSALQDFA